MYGDVQIEITLDQAILGQATAAAAAGSLDTI